MSHKQLLSKSDREISSKHYACILGNYHQIFDLFYIILKIDS